MSGMFSLTTNYYTIFSPSESRVAWVPESESQVTIYNGVGSAEPHKLWELQSKGSSNYLEEGYYILRNLASGKFARIEDNTGNIIMAEESEANKFYLRMIDPKMGHWGILESADSTLGWTVSATSPIVVLRDTEQVELKYGKWGIMLTT